MKFYFNCLGRSKFICYRNLNCIHEITSVEVVPSSCKYSEDFEESEKRTGKSTAEFSVLVKIINIDENLLREVASLENNLIIVDPEIMLGKPVLAGTRITVELILEKFAAGETIEQILEDHPQLTRNGILAALA